MFKLNINKKMYHYLFLLSIVILAIAIGLYFGLPNNKKESNNVSVDHQKVILGLLLMDIYFKLIVEQNVPS